MEEYNIFNSYSYSIFCIKGAVNFGHLFPLVVSCNNHQLNLPLNSFISSWSWNFLERFKNTMLKNINSWSKTLFSLEFHQTHICKPPMMQCDPLHSNAGAGTRMKSNAQSTFQMPCCNLRATHFWGERIFFSLTYIIWYLAAFGPTTEAAGCLLLTLALLYVSPLILKWPPLSSVWVLWKLKSFITNLCSLQSQMD